jgi:hypothetical protein
VGNQRFEPAALLAPRKSFCRGAVALSATCGRARWRLGGLSLFRISEPGRASLHTCERPPAISYHESFAKWHAPTSREDAAATPPEATVRGAAIGGTRGSRAIRESSDDHETRAFP